MKKFIVNFLSQILPVMLGVYLGFAMNNFGERQKLKNQSNTYQEMLKNEISDNLKAIERVNPYHKKISKDFSDLLTSENLPKEFANLNFSGFRTGFVNNSAYNTGIQTGIIQEFDLNLIQSINKLYTLQGKYTRFNETMINSFLSNKFPETESEIKNVLILSSMNMNDVLVYEEELTMFYEKLLDQL